MKQYGPWKIKSSAQIYRDPFLELTLDQVVRPDGKDGQHVAVEIKHGVCVLAMDDQDHVYLTDEFHYAIGRDSIEAVSGGIEPGEDPDSTAKRELQEELGLEAATWQHLTTVDPFTSIMKSPTRLYLATDLKEVATNPEGAEQIRRVHVPLSQAVAMVKSGEITHAPSCVLILLAAAER